MHAIKILNLVITTMILIISIISGIIVYVLEAKAHDDAEFLALYNTLSKSTAKLEDGFVSGSGFYVRKNYLITNEHVVASSETGEFNVKVRDDTNEYALYRTITVGGTVIYKDKQLDIAVVYTPDFEGIPLKISSADRTHIGETVVSVSSPYGFFNSLLVGRIVGKNINNIDTNIEFVSLDLDLAPGSSGGAVFNMKGEVVGICNLLIGRFNSAEFAQDVSIIYDGAYQAILLHEKGEGVHAEMHREDID